MMGAARLPRWTSRMFSAMCVCSASNINTIYSEETNDNNDSIKIPKRRSTQDLHLEGCGFVAKGRRSYLEDTFYISPDSRFAACFDGHGGSDISKYLRKTLYAELLTALESQGNFLGNIGHEGKDIPRALATAFQKTEAHILSQDIWDHQGSTATVVYCSSAEVWTANVGDSRAVLSRRGIAIPLTKDHKPTDPDEIKRIEALGGKIGWFGRMDSLGEPVPGMGVYRVNENLAMTRAVGDKPEKPYISSEPTIERHARDIVGDQFIIIGTDGIWDVLSNQDAVDFVTNNNNNGGGGAADKHSSARRLVIEALRKGSTDNIAVVVLWL